MGGAGGSASAEARRHILAKVSFLRRKTNITQAPGQDTPRCVTLGGLYTAAERIQPVTRMYILRLSRVNLYIYRKYNTSV